MSVCVLAEVLVCFIFVIKVAQFVKFIKFTNNTCNLTNLQIQHCAIEHVLTQNASMVDTCPGDLDGVNEASKRLECGVDSFGHNQYMCTPNVEKTSLFEYCYDGIMGIQEKGL